MCDYCRKQKLLEGDVDSYIHGKVLVIWNESHDATTEFNIEYCLKCGDKLVDVGELTQSEKREWLLSTNKWTDGQFGTSLYHFKYGTRSVDVAYNIQIQEDNKK